MTESELAEELSFEISTMAFYIARYFCILVALE